ncbi:octopamine receptor beta-1R-like [Patiria miniata]|uniref:G-protein coupled receptors family 1 profile domain-containing protein n=1 Tax=Patiria miniata TaxID=46514 RepID=A0A913ZZL0_PATMI|nr:octopamine receptor beta-1R-like [Patiria miniata]XP_038056889.1 octopamine receptor beta-1R-like [Patiria miniata]
MVENVILGLKYAVSVCSTLAILGNLLMIAALVWTTKLRIKYFQLVFNMALADMFFAAFSTAFPWTEYHIIYSLFMTGYVVSVLMSLAIGVNRYLAFSLSSPSRYDSLFTGRRLLILILLIWCLSILLNLLPIVTASEGVTIWIYGLLRPLTVFISWLVLAVLYGVLFYKVRKNTRASVVPRPSTDTNFDNSPTDTLHTQIRWLLATFIVIPVASFVFWMPYSVVRITAFVDPNHFFAHNLDVAYWFSGSLYCIAAAINPLIYWGRLNGLGQGVYTRLEGDGELDPEIENAQPAINTLI